MMRLTGSLALLFLIPTTGFGQEMAPWANKFFTKEVPPPAVILNDFGTVPQGTLLAHKFPITNIYAVPMQVTEIRKTCGCVNATASIQVLQPRETGTIDVTMDARKFTGPRTVTIYVTVGPQFISTAVLQVKAISRADVMLNPGSVSFGVVPQGQPASQYVDVIYNGTSRNWALEGLASNNSPFEVRMQPLTLQQGRGYRVTATLKPDAPAGPLSEQLIIQTNDPANPTVSVQVTGVIQAPLAVVGGNEVRLNLTAVGQTSEQRSMIQGPRPFKIVKVEGEGDGITVEVPPITNKVQIVKIRYQPTAPGNVKRKLIFHTDLGRDAIATVTVDASAQ